jgi:hypothetical protein
MKVRVWNVTKETRVGLLPLEAVSMATDSNAAGLLKVDAASNRNEHQEYSSGQMAVGART